MWNQEDPWYKQPSITKELISFHHKHASVPAKNEVNGDAQALIGKLRLYLKQNFNLCDRPEFTGSYYEKINICGEVTELDVMFVCRQDLYIEDKKNGLCRVRTGNNMFLYPQDDRGFVDPERYRNFFRGKVARWINKMNNLEGFENIRLIEHGVSAQIDVLKEDGELWYQVDLVPCFDIGGNLYVPKPINNAEDMWRHSFSLEEREAVSKFTDDTKMVCRIVKALFKLRFDGLLKIYTSYYIKTTAIILCNDGWRPQKSQLGLAVYKFLSAVRGHLESKYLEHQFQPGNNLLENTRDDLCIQMANTLANHLRSKDSFLRALKSVDKTSSDKPCSSMQSECYSDQNDITTVGNSDENRFWSPRYDEEESDESEEEMIEKRQEEESEEEKSWILPCLLGTATVVGVLALGGYFIRRRIAMKKEEEENKRRRRRFVAHIVVYFSLGIQYCFIN